MAKLDDAIESIRSVLESNLIDVWEIATGRTRDQVFVNDIRLSGDFPKVFIDVDPSDSEKLNWGGGRGYHKMRKSITINVFYLNKERQKYDDGTNIYENGGSNTSRDLNMFMRTEIERVLLTNNKSLTNVHNLRTGTLSQTTSNGDIYEGFIPLTFEYVEVYGTPGA